ncbi:MAG: carbohydrate ABC transporter permease [Thermotoga sp.]|nr:MAG: carbohydrate ABC transporter permease [Thermotoga sp.]
MKIITRFSKILALTLYLIFALIPLYWIIITSLKGPKEIYTFPIKYLPTSISLESYKHLFKFTNFAIYFRNSLIVSLSASFGALLITMFGGYAVSRYNFRFKKYMLLALFFTQMVPTFMVMVPLYTIFSKVGMVNKLTTLAILYTNMMIPFSAIMAKGFFDRIPISLEEAALIDGCSRLQALFKIVIPLTLPGLSAIFSFSFVNTWNELFLAVMFMNSDVKMTIPVALNSFISKAGIGWDLMSAGLVIALLPTMVVFAFAQRYIVAGLTRGAVKG